MNTIAPAVASTVLVTVTYGQRVAYVLKALESALAEGVQHAIVIDNGSVEPVDETLRERFGDWVTVECFNRNEGSAPAFKRGIQLARESGCELILLLDDDNVVKEGCLQYLKSSLKELASTCGDNNCMVLAFRPGHVPGESIADTGSYLGFHFRHAFQKVLRRLRGRTVNDGCLASVGCEVLPYAPYSGLLFHRSLISRHGLPREDFVLYADDTEFSYRVTQQGGRIVLDRRAELQEIEVSWGDKKSVFGFIDSFICQGTDTSVYYNTRNRIFFETHLRRHSAVVRRINAGCVRFLFACYALLRRRLPRLRVINAATADGVNGSLGVNRVYSLSGRNS
jgi:GT2 family glycosyltransferase